MPEAHPHHVLVTVEIGVFRKVLKHHGEVRHLDRLRFKLLVEVLLLLIKSIIEPYQ